MATQEAVAFARAAKDPDAVQLGRLAAQQPGDDHADGGDFEQALEIFQEALDTRERIGDPVANRIACWMVARALRNLGRREESLAMQRALKAELDAAGRATGEKHALADARTWLWARLVGPGCGAGWS